MILIGSLALGFVLGLQFVRWPQAQEVQEPVKTPKVTDDELKLYIAVYTAMQADHDLTIEQALAPHHVSVEKFRHIERRVQAEQRLVDKVRLALLNQAKSLNTWGEQTPTGTPPPHTVQTPKAKPAESPASH